MIFSCVFVFPVDFAFSFYQMRAIEANRASLQLAANAHKSNGMTPFQAAEFADDYLFKFSPLNKPEDEKRIISQVTIDENHWIFFYASKRFLETGDTNYSLSGNCPLFITRKGEFTLIPSSMSSQTFVESWRTDRWEVRKVETLRLRRFLWGRYYLPIEHLKQIEATMEQRETRWQTPEDGKIRLDKLRAGW